MAFVENVATSDLPRGHESNVPSRASALTDGIDALIYKANQWA